MNSTPPWSRMRWRQPDSRTVRQCGSPEARRRYGTGNDAWNFQGMAWRDGIGGLRPVPNCGRVYPTERVRQPNEGPVLGSKNPSRAPILSLMTLHFPFEHTYARLPANFFARVAPTPVAAPRLIKLNRALAVDLGLDPDLLSTPDGAEILAGKRLPEGAEPIAMAYAGHQFGHFVPQLGDGRAILLGEVVDKDGVRRDIQLKGSGPTPFSRRGDGRAALGPVLREYIVSEAMASSASRPRARSPPSMTGESVMRETALPGAVLTRVAASHIRVGTFQFFAARGDTDGVRRLADHVIAPALSGSGAGRPALSRAARRGDRAPGRPRRALAAGRLHPWRDEHRQHVDLGRDHRLRPLRLHGRIRSRDRVLVDRRDGPLRLWQPAAHRAVEPDAARRMPAAAVFRRQGQGDRTGAICARRIRRKIHRGLSGRPARTRSACSRSRGRRGAGAGSAGRDGQEPGRLHPHLPPPRRCRARSRQRRARPRLVRRSHRVRCMGGALAAADRGEPQSPPSGERRCTASTRPSFRATIASRR